MRCFYVLVHGTLNWPAESYPTDEGHPPFHPLGFYCHRYVLASDEVAAANLAFRRVRGNLDKQTHWFSSGQATLELDAEDVESAPLYKLLKPDNRGHTFYH